MKESILMGLRVKELIERVFPEWLFRDPCSHQADRDWRLHSFTRNKSTSRRWKLDQLSNPIVSIRVRGVNDSEMISLTENSFGALLRDAFLNNSSDIGFSEIIS